MAKLPSAIGAITVFVDDLNRSTTFYRTVFGESPVYQDPSSAVFGFGETVVNLLDVAEAPGLIAPANVAASGSGSRYLLSIWVEDVDAVAARLAGLGIALVNGPIDRDWGKRTACFADPDGTLWEIAQDISPADRR